MLKILSGIALMAAIPGAALAVAPVPTPDSPTTTVNQTVNQNSSNQNSSNQNQSQNQNQKQQQQANASSNASANASSTASANNSQTSNTTFNQEDKRQAPPVFVSSSNTTAPCVVAVSGGASIPGFGFGIGGGKKDKGCERRSRIELLAKFNKRAARAYMCDSDPDVLRAYKETGQDCYAPEVVVASAPVPTVIPPAPQVVVTVQLLPAPAVTYSKPLPHRRPRAHHRHARPAAAPCWCVKAKRN